MPRVSERVTPARYEAACRGSASLELYVSLPRARTTDRVAVRGFARLLMLLQNFTIAIVPHFTMHNLPYFVRVLNPLTLK